MWNFDSAGPVEIKWGDRNSRLQVSISLLMTDVFRDHPLTGLGKYDGGQAKYEVMVMMVFCGNGSERDIKTWAKICR